MSDENQIPNQVVKRTLQAIADAFDRLDAVVHDLKVNRAPDSKEALDSLHAAIGRVRDELAPWDRI